MNWYKLFLWFMVAMFTIANISAGLLFLSVEPTFTMLALGNAFSAMALTFVAFLMLNKQDARIKLLEAKPDETP